MRIGVKDAECRAQLALTRQHGQHGRVQVIAPGALAASATPSMAPKLPEDTVSICRALLAGHNVAASALLKHPDALQWCTCDNEVLSDRGRLAAQAAVRLLAQRRLHPGGAACRLFLKCATGQAAEQAVQDKLHQFVELQQLGGRCEAGTDDHINRSAASFHQPGPDAAEPALTVASCGAETMTVLFTPQLQDAEVGECSGALAAGRAPHTKQPLPYGANDLCCALKASGCAALPAELLQAAGGVQALRVLQHYLAHTAAASRLHSAAGPQLPAGRRAAAGWQPPVSGGRWVAPPCCRCPNCCGAPEPGTGGFCWPPCFHA